MSLEPRYVPGAVPPVPSAESIGSGEDSLVRIVDELTTRFQAGEQVNLNLYIQAHPEHAEPGQEVGVPVPVGVIQVSALGPLVGTVEADGVQRPRQLGVQVPVGQGVALPVPGREQVRQVKSHGDKCADSPRLLASRGVVRR